MKRRTKIAIGIGALTALFEVAYWALVFTGLIPVTDLVPGYRHWFLAFATPDAWIAVSGVWLVAALARRGSTARVAAACLGSALIFLGLYAVTYGAVTGLLFDLTTDELIEIAIKVYCLSAGSFLIWFSAAGQRRQVEVPPGEAV
jgi:hypothetical protein